MSKESRARAQMPPFLESLIAGFGSLLPTLIRKRSMAQLAKLNDSQLRDIGLARYDVERMRRHW